MATRRYGMDIVLSQKEGASEGDTGTGHWEPKLLRHGPSRGALKQDLKRGGGTFLAREAGCVVCVGCVAGVQILAFQAGQRPELGAASGQSRSRCRGAVSGARNKECEGGAGDVGRAGGVRNGRNGQGLFHFSNHFTTDTFPSLSAIDRVVEVLFLQTIRCKQ